ncbi:hypothetical protein PGT21_032266 [Puccinia graminis f. sp. tritici]|uniref:Uncharacterized protein n=1 Tax=Puccinia graminis f. sp. tritici TaxID=56615 RepID=A0A5B0PST2_PUCGR|nr:hypothetical protein PGTUg99_013797 [Puccinia graminis f. sp. tritici]KAA1104817.1 hypothetical protein PGT21_032266 [Puccinia graminis f. sp. tritici]KAA1133269.1 hypothetical protein PGTUg99_017277 [Puccinia graminis f. sp. tritici]
MPPRDSTPDNFNVNPNGNPACPPSSAQVATRQSARKKTRHVVPGFIPTDSDSRRALALTPSTSPTSINLIPSSIQEPLSNGSSQELSIPPEKIYDIVQDSDEENEKAAARSCKSKADKKIAPRKDGTDSVLLYFLQVEDSLSYSCLWCPKIVKASSSSYYNLKIHHDGSNIKGTI